MCRVFSCVVGRGCLLWPACSLEKPPLDFALVHFVLQGQTCWYSRYLLTFYIRSVLEKCKSKLQWGITSHQSEWPPSKCLQIINAREGGEKRKHSYTVQFSSVQSLSRVRHFATPWIAACQASLSITNSRSSLNSCPSSRWCHPAISSFVIPFSSFFIKVCLFVFVVDF